MREKFQQFMTGRYGADQLGRFTLITAMICIVISMLFHSFLWNTAAVVLVVFSYYRMLSRNYNRRYTENMIYLKYSGKAAGFFRLKGQRLLQLKDYHIYKCPSCRQKIRIPRGKGKISVTCPKCRTEFVKKS